MAKIHYLEENLKNMIAAGEVVERPSGIIKELVDNAIDANATRIEVRIKAGGLEEIEVIDDGEGMDFDDALLCFKRHATSKISQESDLFKILSLGFRGEALPSIASVSNVTLKTNDGNEGTEVKISYGKTLKHELAACNRGTYLKISGLFYQTPARLKYLKSEQYEQAITVDIINKFALANPNISFLLQNETNTLVSTIGDNNLKNTIFSIYGREIAKNSFNITGSDIDYELQGIGVLPNFSRANKYYINLYINSRMIKQYQLTKVIVDAYHKFMPDNRFPIISLNIKMDAQLVDVNVHPAKWEVRISKQKQLEKLIYESIIENLEKKMQIPTLQSKDIIKQQDKSVEKSYQIQMNKNDFDQQPIIINDDEQEIGLETKNVTSLNYNDFPNNQPISNTVILESSDKVEAFENNEVKQKSDFNHQSQNLNEKEDSLKKTFHSEIANFKIIGNLHSSYIICENEEGLVLIDQHSAMERYNFEKFQKTMFSQKALIPLLIPLELSSRFDSRRVLKINTELKEVGINYEVFGDKIIVRAIPSWLKAIQEPKVFLEDILELFESNSNYVLNELTKDRIATKACKASIKFNQYLTIDEQKEIVNKLASCSNPYNCPHGRPTLIKFSNTDLERLFKR